MLLLPLLFACNPPVADPPPYETLDLAEQVAEGGVERWAPDQLAFDWIPTVWAYGLFRLHTATDDPTWQDYYRSWLQRPLDDIARGSPPDFHSSDSLSPVTLAAALMVEDPAADLTPITDLADAYLATAPRTQQGAIEHWTEDSPFGVPGQVWVDSQFMFGVYLLLQYERTNDAAHLDTFVTQYQLFSDLCRDPADQLYRHAYDDASGTNIPSEAVYWARGNSWVLVSAAELLTRVPADSEAAAAIRPLFVAHAAAIVATQDSEDGLWHTVLNRPQGDDPANYTETSASALIAYGLARGLRAGALDEATYGVALSHAVRGLHARVEQSPDEAPVVEGTSFGTNPGDYDYYVAIETRDDLMLGVGAVVMALAEVDGLADPLSVEETR